MKWLPKREGALGGAPIPNLNQETQSKARSAFPQPCWLAFGRHCEGMRAEIRALRWIQRPIGWAFWLLEQRIARLVDELERRRA